VEHSKCIQHVSIRLISWETHCKFDWRTGGDYNLGTFQMYPACSGLGKLESHGRGHLKCTQPVPTGHIGVTCCLYSQCIQYVPGGYLGPCPQCVQVGEVVLRVRQGRPNIYIPGLRIGSGARTSGILVPLEVEVERTDGAVPYRFWVRSDRPNLTYDGNPRNWSRPSVRSIRTS